MYSATWGERTSSHINQLRYEVMRILLLPGPGLDHCALSFSFIQVHITAVHLRASAAPPPLTRRLQKTTRTAWPTTLPAWAPLFPIGFLLGELTSRWGVGIGSVDLTHVYPLVLRLKGVVFRWITDVKLREQIIKPSRPPLLLGRWHSQKTCVFVRLQVNESNLRQVFSSHGAVKEVKIVQDRTGMSKGWVNCIFPL